MDHGVDQETGTEHLGAINQMAMCNYKYSSDISLINFISVGTFQQGTGGATIQLSWTTNPNPWALTPVFKLNVSYFGSTEVWGYIKICVRQISQKGPLSTCFYQSS